MASNLASDVAERLLDIPQVGDCLSVSRSQVYELIAAGAIESVKIGKRRLVPAAAVTAYIASLREAQS